MSLGDDDLVEMTDLEKKIDSMSHELAGMKYLLQDFWTDINKKLNEMKNLKITS